MSKASASIAASSPDTLGRRPKGTSNPFILKAVILAIALQEIGGGAVAPVVADIIADMPQHPVPTVMLISTIPYLAIVLTSMSLVFIESHFKKRTLAIFSISLFCASGIIPFFLGSNLVPIIVCRFVFGIAVGILMPLSMNLVNGFFTGSERAAMLGFVQTASSLGAIMFQTLGGFLGAIDWHYCFLAYLVAIVVLVFAYFALPEPSESGLSHLSNHASKDERECASKNVAPVRRSQPWMFALYCLGFCIYAMCVIVFINNISIVISANQWGDAATSGLCLSAHTIGGIVSSLFFGWLYSKTKSYCLGITVIAGALGFGLVACADSLLVAFAGSVLSGAGTAVVCAAFFNQFAVDSGGDDRLTSFGVAAQNLGFFLGVYAVSAVLAFTGGDFGRDAITVAAIASCVVGVALLVQGLVVRKQEKQTSTKQG